MHSIQIEIKSLDSLEIPWFFCIWSYAQEINMLICYSTFYIDILSFFIDLNDYIEFYIFLGLGTDLE